LPGQGVDLKLRISLREGSVYYFTDRSLTSPEPHYFIVVNADPVKQEVLLLGVCSSKVAEVKARRRDFPETIVEIVPRAFDVLKKLSIVLSLVVAPADTDLAAPEVAAGLEESFGGGGYTARQRAALLQLAADHVASALDGGLILKARERIAAVACGVTRSLRTPLLTPAP
jgi:hypothetical protein